MTTFQQRAGTGHPVLGEPRERGHSHLSPEGSQQLIAGHADLGRDLGQRGRARHLVSQPGHHLAADTPDGTDLPARLRDGIPGDELAEQCQQPAFRLQPIGSVGWPGERGVHPVQAGREGRVGHHRLREARQRRLAVAEKRARRVHGPVRERRDARRPAGVRLTGLQDHDAARP